MTDDGTFRFEALRMGFRQDKEGYVMMLRIHPDDAQQLALDPVGQRYYIAATRVDEHENPIPIKTKTKGQIMVQQAGILCKEKKFQQWMVDQGHALDVSEKDCSNGLRILLGLESRSDLATNPQAQETFTALMKEYVM